MISTFNRTVQALADESDPRMIRHLMTQNRPKAIERLIGYFSPNWALKRATQRNVLAYANRYKAADSTTLRTDWISFTTGSNQTPGGYELGTLRERSRDANRNDPVASGAVSSRSPDGTTSRRIISSPRHASG